MNQKKIERIKRQMLELGVGILIDGDMNVCCRFDTTGIIEKTEYENGECFVFLGNTTKRFNSIEEALTKHKVRNKPLISLVREARNPYAMPLPKSLFDRKTPRYQRG